MSKIENPIVAIKARRSELVDAQEIVKLVNHSTLELFGIKSKDLGKLFEFM
jgi:hypothetical protein